MAYFLDGLFFSLLLASSMDTTHLAHLSLIFSPPDKGKNLKHLVLTNSIRVGFSMSFPLPLTLQRILSSFVKRDRTKFAAKFRLEVLLVNTFVSSCKDIDPTSKELSS